MRSKIGHEILICAGAGVFLYKDGKVLLQKRKDSLCWSMPGGRGVEIGESVMEAASRELFEETGPVAGRFELLGDFSGELLPETDEALALPWFAIDDLPQNFNPPGKKRLQTFSGFLKRLLYHLDAKNSTNHSI